MRAPRRNIELKATDPDPSASLEVCRALGAEDHGTITQRDTYFEVTRGGLKLREEQLGRPHLIQFERASERRCHRKLTRAQNPEGQPNLPLPFRV